MSGPEEKSLHPPTPGYLVIIPAYNEAARIAGIVQRLRTELKSSADILVVDDGSRDETAVQARSAGARVIRHPFNLGYGAALQTGYKFALGRDYRMVAQMDADGQHDEAYINRLFAALEAESMDVAVGSRFLDASLGGSYRAGFFRRLVIRLLAAITSWAVGGGITDPTSGFQAFRRRVLPSLASDAFPYDFPDADVLIMLHRQGFKLREIPVPMYAKAERKSIHSGFKPLYYVVKMFLAIIVALIRRREPAASPNP